MIGTLDVIDLLPYEMKCRTEADEFFCDVPVVVAEDGNVKQEIETRWAALTRKGDKRGVAVIIPQIVADDDYAPQFGPLTLRPAFQVIENVELNRDANGTKKSARKVARRLRDVFKNFYAPGLVANFQPDKPLIEPLNLLKDQGALIRGYQVNFKCLEVPSQILGQVQLPDFVLLAPQPQFAITCSTPGAQIYYTLDDSYPAAGNATAIAYVTGEPINIPAAGVTVRACAYLQGMIASSVNRKTIIAV
jgi:hypothetical protein